MPITPSKIIKILVSKSLALASKHQKTANIFYLTKPFLSYKATWNKHGFPWYELFY